MKSFRSLALGIPGIIWLVGAASCRPLHDPPRQEGMGVIATDIVGRWTRTTDSSCSAQYPQELEFSDRGLYSGRTAGGFSLWDVGSWEVLDDQRIRISTANDAEIPYRFVLSGDTLSFSDPDGCEFAYRRVP